MRDSLRSVRHRRGHQRMRHRARRGGAGTLGGVGGDGRPGGGHVVRVDQAVPWRAALPGILGGWTGTQGFARTRRPAPGTCPTSRGPCGSSCRSRRRCGSRAGRPRRTAGEGDALDEGQAAGLADPHGAVDVRHAGQVEIHAGHADDLAGGDGGGRAPGRAVPPGLRVFRRLGRGQPPGGAERPRRGGAGGRRVGAHQGRHGRAGRRRLGRDAGGASGRARYAPRCWSTRPGLGWARSSRAWCGPTPRRACASSGARIS